jgi:hypothetical protein
LSSSLDCVATYALAARSFYRLATVRLSGVAL